MNASQLRGLAMAIAMGTPSCGDPSALEPSGEGSPFVAVPDDAPTTLNHVAPQGRCDRPGRSVPAAVTVVSGSFSGALPLGITPAAGNAFWFADLEQPGLYRVASDGALTFFPADIEEGPADVASDRSGNAWFAAQQGDGTHRLGKMAQDGSSTLLEIPGGRVLHVAFGEDGNVWFTQNGGIGRLTRRGELTRFEVPAGQPSDITAGPGHSVWFTDPSENRIGRFSHKGTFGYFMLATREAGLGAITSTPDGSIWFTEINARRVGRLRPSGLLEEFEIPGDALPEFGDIALGPDGAIWFSQVSTDPYPERTNAVGRITLSGEVSQVLLPRVLDTQTGLMVAPTPAGLVAGRDGALWLTARLEPFTVGAILRIAPAHCEKRPH